MRTLMQGMAMATFFVAMAAGDSLYDLVTGHMSCLPIAAGIAVMTTVFMIAQLYVKKYIRPRMRQKRILKKIRYDSWLHGSY